MTTIHWEQCDTAEATLEHLVFLARAGGSYSPETLRDEIVPEVIQRLKEIRLAGQEKTKPTAGPKPELPKATAAVIEVVERGIDSSELGVVKPNEIRINGVPILVPTEDFLEIEGLDDSRVIGANALIVSIRMYARRILIGEPG